MEVRYWKNGSRINEARRIKDILHIASDEPSNIFTIYGVTEEAIMTARSMIEVLEEIIPIPGNLSSKVIGTRGSTINSVVTESGVISAHIINLPDDVRTTNRKAIEVVGNSSSILKARNLFNKILNPLEHEPPKITQPYREFMVSSEFMGLAIGPKGSNIKKAREIAGVTKIDLERESNIFTIYGTTEDAVQRAQSMLLFEKDFMSVPKELVGMVMGKNKRTINEIKSISGVGNNEEPKTSTSSSYHSNTPGLLIVGTRDTIANAKVLLNRHLAEANSRSERSSNDKNKKSFKTNEQEYLASQKLEDSDNIIANNYEFDCPVCFSTQPPGTGIILAECLHSFCKDCIKEMAKLSTDVEIKCPHIDDETNKACDKVILHRVLKRVMESDFEHFLQKTILFSEQSIANTVHCKTINCTGFTILEGDDDIRFICEVCDKSNCIKCDAIHEGSCEFFKKTTDGTLSNAAIQKLIDEKKVMLCPKCKAVIEKTEGCDGFPCFMCKTDLCWATKGARWGPGGPGDTSGGCRCNLYGIRCHPDCKFCH